MSEQKVSGWAYSSNGEDYSSQTSRFQSRSLGLFRCDPRLAQKPDESTPQKRLKRRSSEVD